MLGIYIHIPFCTKKCPYCDFYSVSFCDSLLKDYISAVKKAILSYKGKNLYADTLYFGGGTPNLIGPQNMKELISAVKESFALTYDAEITMEANPETFSKQDISEFKKAGINRLSLGLQSANLNELESLGRTHTPEQVTYCINEAKRCGIDRISLDLMIATMGQTAQSIQNSVDFCISSGAEHISSYLLKIEPNTPFYKQKDSLDIPDDDKSAEYYELICSLLKKGNFEQYEISNFAKNGAVSRHNLKYWLCEEYIGIGPSAHGFFEGKRYFYERDILKFIENPTKTVFDCIGGNSEEAFMLNLRLSKGIDLKLFAKKYNCNFSDNFFKTAEKFISVGLMEKEKNIYRLTEKGFLVSNSIISSLLEHIN